MVTTTTYIVLALIIVVLVLLIPCVRIVPQAKIYVIERLGAYWASWDTGLHVLIPFFDRISKKVSIKEQVYDFPPQPVITKDNVTMLIDTVVFCVVTDAKLYTYGVENPHAAIENLATTTLRNIIGALTLDETLTSRDIINTQITETLDRATDRWGVKVNRVELKNIQPPAQIQEAMEKQMRAERERRELILQAEGEKQSKILVAEGVKQSQILQAEAAKQAVILAAEAEKEKQIQEAHGEAEAILLVQKALAEGIQMLNQSAPSQEVLTLKSLEAFQKAADGQATKIIIPSQIQGIAGLASSIKELL